MNILITAPYHEQARQELEKGFGHVIYRPWKPHGRAYNEQELIDLLEETHADALITEHDAVTSMVIESHPGLQFIGVCRGTPSNVAVQAATDKGIPVFNTPARNAQAVAEMFIANIITFMRNTFAGIQWLKEEKWGVGAHTSYLEFKGNELAGKKVGMVGFGAVGQTIANLLTPFPCEIRYYDPFYTAPEETYKKMALDELFRTSDIVAIHLPVTPQTEGMIDRKLLSLMKPDAIFVNTARAAVVNRDDLIEVVTKGKIRGAILDVFDHEPPDAKDYELIHHPNVLATPHIAGATHEVEDHHADIMNRNLQRFYKEDNKQIRQLVNQEVLQKEITSSQL